MFDEISELANKIIDDVKAHKVYTFTAGPTTYVLEWSEVVENVIEDIEDGLLEVIRGNGDATVYIKLDEELARLANEMAELIIKTESTKQKEQREIDDYEYSRSI